ncbi:hypothetical protein HNR00_003583 [Methylorubrum rhodinum]|uniref:Uncharacterized protein n=1 Tax=Methylorubrum rhodinum TaxID=29428 RepID=A0A840ZMN5_9HYPH|nr:hypothetical protein [Methylorubrum rhodinum]MBB5758856.1 hypothetical protein [Methylorubrum rhodinum]
MSPAQAIAALDRQLRRHGQDVTLHANGREASVTVRGRPSGYRPDELGQGVLQGMTKIVLSPTGLEAYGRPRKLDTMQYGGWSQTVEVVDPIWIDGEVVRFEIWATG